MDNFNKRIEVESLQKWDEIFHKIPSLNFDKEWDIKIIPPYRGAVARFLVYRNGDQVCSVYLDWYERLGIFGAPYYQLYPFEDDTRRYGIEDTDELIKDIRKLYEDAK